MPPHVFVRVICVVVVVVVHLALRSHAAAQDPGATCSIFAEAFGDQGIAESDTETLQNGDFRIDASGTTGHGSSTHRQEPFG
jgi:hypothetical protein